VTILGGGNTTIIDAAGMNTGNFRDRAFISPGRVSPSVFQNWSFKTARPRRRASGASTTPRHKTPTASAGILNNGGSVTLTNVIVNRVRHWARATP